MKRIPEDIIQLNIHSFILVKLDFVNTFGYPGFHYIPLVQVSYVKRGETEHSPVFYSFSEIMGDATYTVGSFSNHAMLRNFVERHLDKGVRIFVKPENPRYEGDVMKKGEIFEPDDVTLLYYQAANSPMSFHEILHKYGKRFYPYYEDGVTAAPSRKDCITNEESFYDSWQNELSEGNKLLDIQDLSEGTVPLKSSYEVHRMAVDHFYVISFEGRDLKKVYVASGSTAESTTSVTFCPTHICARRFITEDEALIIALTMTGTMEGRWFSVERIDERTIINL